jgi:hypothetical protein
MPMLVGIVLLAGVGLTLPGSIAFSIEATIWQLWFSENLSIRTDGLVSCEML